MWLYTQCSIGIVETSVSSMTSVVDGLPVDLPHKAESRHDICSGPYLLQNVNSGAVLDVAASNDRLVKCFDSHKERNQRVGCPVMTLSISSCVDRDVRSGSMSSAEVGSQSEACGPAPEAPIRSISPLRDQLVKGRVLSRAHSR